MSTTELEGRRRDVPPRGKRYLWSPERWAISLASLLVASCGHFNFGNGGVDTGDGGVDTGDGGVDASGGGRDAGDGGVDDGSNLPINGLVAWYPMDHAISTGSTGSGTFVDASGHNNGTCDPGRCPTFAPHPTGRIGGAYMFDGINDLFHVPSTAELENTGGFTITAWLNRAPSTLSGCVINKSYSDQGDNSWQACIRNDGAVRFYSTDDGTDGDTLDGGTIDTSAWHHLALWWNGASKATYVDGALVASTLLPKTVSIVFDDAAIDIGSDIDVNTETQIESPFKGLIADVRIYNRALSPPEIAALWSH